MISSEQGVHVIPTKFGRGFYSGMGPQEEVLALEAVGGFLTHSGVNSTREGICAAALPMLCWSQVADQPVTCRWVGEVWKIGLDMKDTCDRFTVEKMVRALMEETDERKETLESVNKFAKLARDAVGQGGSSCNNLEKLIQDLRETCKM